MAEVEERAPRYGLPPVVWPDAWPASALAADRAALWAQEQKAVERFVLVLYRRQFGHGEDIAKLEVLAAAAADIGLDQQQLLDGVQRRAVKDALRHATRSLTYRLSLG